MARSTLLTVCVIVFTTSMTFCVEGKSTEEFFDQFGYLPKGVEVKRGNELSPEIMDTAIIKFQKFNGLKVTGILDKPTLKKISDPRCGVKDFGEISTFRKVSKWTKTSLTWNIKKFSSTSKLSRLQQITTIKKAFRHWSNVTPLTFTEVQFGGDIEIEFAAGRHGDGNSFDGPGGVLAHAFFPSNGNTHFDDSERWTINIDQGINLEIVAAHEFGHALGLAHSQVSTSLMAPYYRGYTPNFKLDTDDVNGIQNLYGKKTATTRPRVTQRPTTRRTTTRHPIGNGYCKQQYNKIDATIRVLDRVDYVFVDQRFVISSKTGRKKRIQTVFSKGPIRVDAAVFSMETNKVYLTYGVKLWSYAVRDAGTRFTLDVGYPKALQNSKVAHMEAMMSMSMSYSYYKSVRIFILKKKYFWELIPSHNYVTSGLGYPTKTFFINTPRPIDSTLTIRDMVYFLSKNKFYGMKVSDRRVSSTGIPVKKLLLPCRNR